MPPTIPFDPSLTLMSVVTDHALRNVQAIAQAQAPVDAAQDALKSLIASKRSLTMTKAELQNLGVGTEALDAELEKLNHSVDKAAADYAKAKIAAEPQIDNLRKGVRSVVQNIESPVDYVRCEIKTMPLAADTLNMDVRYFTYDSNAQNSDSFRAQVGRYVSEAVSTVFGSLQCDKISTAASRQVTRQLASTSIEGTLVMCVTCSHKNASIVAPFILHVDKAIKVWNQLFPGKKLDPTSRQSMMKAALNESQEDKDKFSIISGTTFGSCFVGLIHILKSSVPSVSASLEAAASSLQSSMDAGGCFSRAEGRVGMDASMSKDIKNILGQQNIKTQVQVFTAGVPLSFGADGIIKTVEGLRSFDPKSSMEAVLASQNANLSEDSSVQAMAESSRASGQAPHPNIQTSLDALAGISDNTKTLDANSLMSALEEYLNKASEGSSGVPINYYLEDIDQKMLAQMWVAKYFPGQFMAIKYDDTEGAGPATEKATL
ncbi:hypothetical protein FBEOM_11938 [Fusarium beomiforme]|uniref:Uncharacterized protein n=1 Tax=Fusarium beomiforme TaxID=44412 RepID=A0A9P5DQJ7_9HYPO|nr:hypothetical protein FBEOM_11938 [Fusarium beomiforme]